MVCYSVHANGMCSLPSSGGMGRFLAHLLGSASVVGRDSPRHHDAVFPCLPGAASVMDNSVANWPGASSIRESHGAPRGHTSTGEKVPSSLLESCFAHVRHYLPPRVKNEVEWFRPGHTLVAVDHLYPIRCFPIVGEWHLRPRESWPMPPALQLHFWHYISGVSVSVPEKTYGAIGVR